MDNCICENIIVGSTGLQTCVDCGTINQDITLVETHEFKPCMSFINKTVIAYHPKFTHLLRLQKWSNYSYYEVRDSKLKYEIDNFKFETNEVRALSMRIFMDDFVKVKTRGKVKYGLMALSIYKAHLILNLDIDIDDWLIKLKLTHKHFNNSNSKTDEKIFYPLHLKEYLEKMDIDLDKNKLILNYNQFIKKHSRCNSKSVILSIMFNELEIMEISEKVDFFTLFKIRETNVREILKLIKKIDFSKY